MVDGPYKGERGEVTRELDDMREYGARLVGYSGEGSFHESELEPMHGGDRPADAFLWIPEQDPRTAR